MVKAIKALLTAFILFLVTLVLSVIPSLLNIADIETGRYAEINPDGSILFVVQGFVLCPISAEGAFPRWANSTTAKFSPTSSFSPNHSSVHELGRDFSVQYSAMKSGKITFDSSTNSIKLTGEYIDSYKWNRALGKFQLRVKQLK